MLTRDESDTKLWSNDEIDLENLNKSELYNIFQKFINTNKEEIENDFFNFIINSKFYDYKKKEITKESFLKILELEFHYLDSDVKQILKSDFFNEESKNMVLNFRKHLFNEIKKYLKSDFPYITFSNNDNLKNVIDYKNVKSLKFIDINYDEVFILYKRIIYMKLKVGSLSNIRYFIEQKF